MQRRSLKVDGTRLVGLVLAALYFGNYLATYTEWHFIDNVNLVIHEAGHLILFTPVFGQFISVLGGSLFQVLIPLIFTMAFFLQKEFFSGSIVLFWVGQNLINVSVYAGDAIKMDLPLLGGDNVIHDWHFILNYLGLLQHTDQIALGIFSVGVCVLFLALIGSIATTFSIVKISSNEI